MKFDNAPVTMPIESHAGEIVMIESGWAVIKTKRNSLYVRPLGAIKGRPRMVTGKWKGVPGRDVKMIFETLAKACEDWPAMTIEVVIAEHGDEVKP